MNHARRLKQQQVTDCRRVTEGVYLLSFRRDFRFSAGQVVAIDLVEDGEPRLYSIASGENDTNVEILFDERPEGHLTPRLSALRAGDVIYSPLKMSLCN